MRCRGRVLGGKWGGTNESHALFEHFGNWRMMNNGAMICFFWTKSGTTIDAGEWLFELILGISYLVSLRQIKDLNKVRAGLFCRENAFSN